MPLFGGKKKQDEPELEEEAEEYLRRKEEEEREKEDKKKSNKKDSAEDKQKGKENSKKSSLQAEPEKKKRQPSAVPGSDRYVPPVVKKFTLFRNGDPNFEPLQWLYNSHTYKNWDAVLQDLEGRVPEKSMRWGQGGTDVKNLWTSKGAKLPDKEGLAKVENGLLVIGGTEPFRNLDYDSYTIMKEELKKSPRPPPKTLPSYEEVKEINKKKYQVKRPPEEKIFNRTKPSRTKKFMVYRMGDESFKPKQYIWREKYTPTFEGLCAELKEIAAPSTGGVVNTLFSLDGSKKIKSLEEIEDQGHYLPGGENYEAPEEG